MVHIHTFIHSMNAVKKILKRMSMCCTFFYIYHEWNIKKLEYKNELMTQIQLKHKEFK